MTHWIERAATMTGFAMLAAACSMPMTPAPPDMSFTIDAFAQGMAEAECAGVAARCGVPVATCEQKRKDFWTAEAAKRSARTFVVTRAMACITAWQAAYADGVLTPAEIDVTVSGSAADLCERAFQGPVADRQPCTSNYDCATDGSSCDVVGALSAMEVRVCAQPMAKKSGDGCANPGDTCAVGTYCGLQGGLATCVAKNQKGLACSDSSPCAEDFRCSGGSCIDRVMAGQPCMTVDDCAQNAHLCIDVSGTTRCLASLTFGTGSPACQPYGL